MTTSQTPLDWSTGPLPDLADPDLAPYWDAVAESRLVVRHCSRCDRAFWPPRPACPACSTLADGWVEVAPTGHLFTYTVVGHTALPVFRDLTPYAVGVIEIDGIDNIRMVGRILAPPDALKVGMPLAVHFEAVTDDVTLPLWTPGEDPR